MKKLVSGIQPSNKLTLGNYLGALKNFFQYQDSYESYIFVADLHVITAGSEGKTEIAEYTKNIVSAYVASGLDFDKVTIFKQSDVNAHCALGHIILCHTTTGELSRMTQFKDKSIKACRNGTEYIPTGLLTYPTLMAADILLYDADIVPVGADQKQHLELTRNIATRFNNKYGNTFVIPEPAIGKVGARVMDLQDPTIKMSKSNPNKKGTIFLVDTPEDIEKKIMAAKTDVFNVVKYDYEKQPGISNLIAIYSSITGASSQEVENLYEGKNYGEFKKDLCKIVLTELLAFQKKYYKCLENYDKIETILKENAKKCNDIANKKLDDVLTKMGIK